LANGSTTNGFRMAENFMGASAAWLRDGSERIEKQWTENNGRNSTGTACAKHALRILRV
jgi:hypothetical protein